MKKRLLALLLAVVLTVSCLPHVVLAEGTQNEEQEQATTQAAVAPVDETQPGKHPENNHICEVCEDVTAPWTVWGDQESEKTSLPVTTGHYYLTDNVLLSKRWNVSGTNDVVLCLNGYTVDCQSKCTAYQIEDTAKLTITDCTAHTDADGNYVAGQLTNGKETSVGGLIYAIEQSTFRMFGGKLTNSKNTQTSSDMGWSGGAIQGRGNAYIYLKDCEISGNHTTKQGGAICLREANATGDTASTLYCENVRFKGNASDEKGGVLFLNSEKNSATFKNCTFDGDYTKGSGGVFYSRRGNITVENCTFHGNYCTNGGGVIQMEGGKLNISGSTFDGRNAADKDNATNGGAIYLYAAADMNLKSSTFTNYRASDFGGVVFIKESNTRLIMESGEISGNTGKNGTIYVQTGGTFKMTGGSIKNNTVTGKGGGLYLNGDGVNSYIDGGEITGNTANYGGAVYLENAKNTLHLRGGKLNGNTATTWGGGIYCGASAILKTKGTPEVLGNTVGGSLNNVMLGTSVVVTLDAMGEGTGKIGITVDGSVLPRYVSTDMGGKDYSAYFVSDNTGREIISKDGKLYVQKASDHQHCDCNGMGGDHCDHTKKGWTAWEKTDELPTTTGYYYLTANVKIKGRQSVKADQDVHLCLNGYTVNGNNKCIYEVQQTGKLTLTDCLTRTNEEGETLIGTLTGGKETSVAGAVYVKDDGEARIFNIKLTNNENAQADSALGWSGGAIQIRNNGKLLLVGAELSDNHTTAEGGAICLRDNATATMEECIFRNNAADRKGGAIFVNNTANRLTMKDCVFTGNSSDTGAVLSVYLGTVQIDGCTFEGNTATNNGGAIMTSGGKLTVTNSTFTGNAGKDGGAIRLTSNCTATVTGSTFTGNKATASGGAISSADSNLTLENNKINENISEGTAGAVLFSGQDKVLTLVSGEFKDNTSGAAGGAILVQSRAKFDMKDGIFTGNTSTGGDGGALYISTNCTGVMEKGTITGNTAQKYGGGVMLFGSNFTMHDGMISGNTSVNGAGITGRSGIRTEDGKEIRDVGAVFTMNGGKITENVATTGDGGGLQFAGDNCAATINGGEISNNTAASGGGVIAMTRAVITINDGKITGNTTTKNGGGLFMSFTSVLNVNGGEISDNQAANGGGIYLYGADATVAGGKVVNNTVTANGGGIFCNPEATLHIKDAPEVTGNTAANSDSNVWLGTDIVMTLSEMGEGTGKIGLSVDGGSLPRFVSTEMGEKDYTAYFFSDHNYRKIMNKDGKLYIQNDDTHQHCDCAKIGGEHCDHTNTAWIAWEKTNELPTTSGYYYLLADVNTKGRQSVKADQDVHLCLNGHTVNGNGKNIYEVVETGKLTLTDCPTRTDENGNDLVGMLTGGQETQIGGAVYVKDNAEAKIFGIKLSGNKNTQNSDQMGWSGGAIQVRNNGKLLMVDAELSDNHTTAEGGAICLRDSGQAVLENCTFRNNAADRKGGAIFVNNTANSLTMKNCTFTGNTSDTGAVLSLYKGTVQVDGCTFDGNTATNNGGVTMISGGKLTVTNSTFTGNAGKDGGAIRLIGNCEMTITGSTFTGNKATASGGAISSADSNLTLENNKINENISDGTAGAILFTGKNKVLTLVSGEFKDNTAKNAGGAMLVQSYATFHMQDGIFTGNTSTGGDGGAMYISTNCTGVMEKGTITGNTAQKYGGGIMLFGSNFTMYDGMISGNTSVNGAGITGRSGIRTEDGKEIRDVGAVFTMNGGKITGNTATTGDGGGLQIAGDNCAATINGGEISNNTAASGGGVIAMSYAVITLNDGKIINNTAQNNGGGFFMSYTSVLNVNGGEISDNKATNGGGVYLYGAEATLAGGKITKNTAKDNYGGIGGGGCTQKGVQYRCVLNMKDVTISENKGTNYGGIGISRADITMESGTKIVSNYAQKAVGGMCIMSDSTMKLTGGSISYNTAAEAANGGLYISSRSTLTMTGGTVSYNQCKHDGGGVYLQQSTGYFYGGSIVGNRSEGNGGGMRVGGSTVYLCGTAIQDNYAKASGGGVIATRFKNKGENKDYMPYITIDGSTISGNKCDGPAGGLVVQAPGKTILKSGVLENNESAGNGGAIYVSTNHTFEMSGGEIRNNKANQGAGVYHLASFGTYTGGKITGNIAVKNGGGLVFTGKSNINMKNLSITDNSGWTGGAFVLNNQDVKFTADNCDISRNKAVEAHAGAFYVVWGVLDAQMKNCTITDNYAKQDGGAIYQANGNLLTLTDCTLTGNSAGRQGGAIWSKSPTHLVNCAISDNSAGAEGGGICTGPMGASNIRRPIIMQLENCAMENNTSGAQGGGVYVISGAWFEAKGLEMKGNTSKLEGSAIWANDNVLLTDVTVTNNASENGGYALYYADAEFDGFSYFRGLYKIGGQMIVNDNKGGDLYLGEQTTMSINANGLTGESCMNIKLASGLLTQRLYGAYNYEGGNCEYVVTVGNKSETEPEFDVSMLPQEEPTEGSTAPSGEQNTGKVSPAIFIAGGATAAVIAAVAIIIVAISKKKKPAAGK